MTRYVKIIISERRDWNFYMIFIVISLCMLIGYSHVKIKKYNMTDGRSPRWVSDSPQSVEFISQRYHKINWLFFPLIIFNLIYRLTLRPSWIHSLTYNTQTENANQKLIRHVKLWPTLFGHNRSNDIRMTVSSQYPLTRQNFAWLWKSHWSFVQYILEIRIRELFSSFKLSMKICPDWIKKLNSSALIHVTFVDWKWNQNKIGSWTRSEWVRRETLVVFLVWYALVDTDTRLLIIR